MHIETAPIPSPRVAEYSRIPIAFEVRSVLEAQRRGNNGVYSLVEHRVPRPCIKDYDAISERPLDWATRFHTSRWQLFLARTAEQCVGGAAVAIRTPGVSLLEGRSDLALLWDLRVAPDWRRQGVARLLLGAVEAWAIAQGCGELKIETQNINVAACRFYAALGCQLRIVNEDAYPDCPGEAQFLWYKTLAT